MSRLATLTGVGMFFAAVFSLIQVAAMSWWLALGVFVFGYVIAPGIGFAWKWWTIDRPAREIERNQAQRRAGS